MPFSNEIAAGNGAIVRNWLQSQNFVTGVSGWRISKNGDAEFSNGTFRGSIESGPLTGQHFIVNNTTTGDVIDIYDSSNRLIFSIDHNGVLTSYTYGGGSAAGHMQITGARASFNNNSGFISPDPPSISAPDVVSTGQELDLRSGTPDGNINFPGELQLFGGLVAGSSEVRVTARGINGDVLQLDTGNNTNQMVHVGSYTAGVFDAFGDATINHGAIFTPKYGILQTWDFNSVGQGWKTTWVGNPFTSTAATFFVRDQAGNIPGIGTQVGVHAVFFG